jgi:microcystin-dependent protein
MQFFKTSLVIFCLFLSSESICQNSVGIGTATPDKTAVLEISSNSKGLLIPRLSQAEITTINSPAVGLMVYNTNNAGFEFYDGTKWDAVGLPKGSVIMWTGTIAPMGWALCDGTGGTPNLSGRFIVGYQSPSADYSTIGNTGGVQSVTLSVAQLPAHSHTVNSHNHAIDIQTDATGEHLHGMTLHGGSGSNSERIMNAGVGTPRTTVPSWTKSQETTGSSAETIIDGPLSYTGHAQDNSQYQNQNADLKPAGMHRHRVVGATSSSGGSINSTGSDNSHENRPPYYVLAYIMKK